MWGNDPKYLDQTARFAELRGWWWRKDRAEVFAKEFGGDDAEAVRVAFDARFEEPARRYEIGRRLGKLKFPFKAKSFSKLTMRQMEIVVLAFHREPPAEVAFFTPEKAAEAKPPKGWTKVLFASFNLAHSPERLKARFDEFILAERKRLGMPSKSRSRKGGSHREVSWRYVEMYDLREHHSKDPEVLKLGLVDRSAARKLEALWEGASV